MSDEIPEADYFETVVLTCPIQGCMWSMAVAYKTIAEELRRCAREAAG